MLIRSLDLPSVRLFFMRSVDVANNVCRKKCVGIQLVMSQISVSLLFHILMPVSCDVPIQGHAANLRWRTNKQSFPLGRHHWVTFI